MEGTLPNGSESVNSLLNPVNTLFFTKIRCALFDANGLPGEDHAEIDFLMTQADASAVDDQGGFVVEGIIDAGQFGVMVDRLLPDIIMPRT